MDLIIFDASWMLNNVGLAFIAVIFGLLILSTKSRVSRIILGILWFLFLPNTIYLVTDLTHLPGDIGQNPAENTIIISMYLLLVLTGIATYIAGLYPLDYLLMHRKKKKQHLYNNVFFVFFNFVISLGIVLGRVQRINSWDVFTKPLIVLRNVFLIITSKELFLFFLLFGILCNAVYFSWKHVVTNK